MEEEGEVQTQLNEEEADELFDFIDSNDDGNIDSAELKKFVQLKGMNPTLGQFNEFLTEKGMDPSEEILLSKEEFISLASEMMAKLPSAEEELESALNEIDTSGDGVISKDELREYLTNRGDEPITVEEFDALMGECGVNEDEQTIPKGVLKGLLLGTGDVDASA